MPTKMITRLLDTDLENTRASNHEFSSDTCNTTKQSTETFSVEFTTSFMFSVVTEKANSLFSLNSHLASPGLVVDLEGAAD